MKNVSSPWALVALSVGACAPRMAFAQAELPEVEVRTAEDARRLCAAADAPEPVGPNLPDDPIERGRVRAELRRAREQAANQLSVIVLGARQFHFSEYDEDRSALVVATDRNLRAFDGEIELYPAAASGGIDPIEIRVAAADARRIVDVQRRGEASLRIAFLLGHDAQHGGRSCLLRSAAGTTVARIEIAFVEIVGATGTVLARQDSERYEDLVAQARSARAPTGTGPSVVISSPTVEGDPALGSYLAGDAVRPLQTQLLDCYRQGLRGNGRLQGALVIEIAVEPGGHVRTARVEVDSLGDTGTAGCILGALRAMPMPRTHRVGATRVSLPILLALP